jgi:hypothetical protein
MEGERAGSSSDETDRFRRLIIGLFVLGCVALVFAPVRGFGLISFDDPVTVTSNPLVNAAPDAAKVTAALTYVGPLNLWHPVTWWSHQVDTLLFGFPSPGARHVSSLGLHLLATGLLYLLILRLGITPASAGLAALLFAIHPQRVEPVAWISARKEVLALVWVLAAMLAWLQFRRSGRKRWAGGGTLAGLAAMASHPAAVVLPVVLVLLDHWKFPVLGARTRPWLPRREYLPLLLGAALVSAVTLWIHYQGGHAAAETLRGPFKRGTGFLLSLGHYAQTLVWPWPRRLFEIPPADIASRRWLALAGLATVGAAVWAWRVAARSRRPVLGFGVAWAGCFLLPVSGLLAAASPYLGADRHTYLPHAGLALGLAVLIPVRGRGARVATGGLLALALLFAGLTSMRLQEWRDDFSLFGAEMRVSPRSKLAPLHLGVAWMLADRPDLALPLFEQSLAIDPGFDLAQRNAALARARLEPPLRLQLGPGPGGALEQ